MDRATMHWVHSVSCFGHAAVLVDDVMYVFGAYSEKEGRLDDLYALQLSSE